jgi:acetyltransferase-like isoleucine patch superfamily enzyme
MIVGAYTYGANKLEVLRWEDKAELIIGKFCSIAGGRVILGGSHRSDWITTYPFGTINEETFPYHGKDCTVGKGNVVIKNDVWIGMNVKILSGVTIGNGAVVATESVVTKDVDDYSFVAGNPAVHKRYRFTEEQRKRLLEIAWWDWSEDKINRHLDILCSGDIDKLLDKATAT